MEEIPRFLIAAPSSGSGKTMITCGILEILRRRGYPVVSYKCGPDYIDPMFHQYVLGIPGCNLDSFFLPPQKVKQLFVDRWRKAPQGAVAVIEGVMGYYDGVAGISTQASAYDIACLTESPVILVIDGRGSSLSLAALVKGFLEYKKDSRIAGVILNRTSPMMEKRLRPYLEELGIRCFGSVMEHEAAKLESRHLGLVLPAEQDRLREKIGRLADLLDGCLDVDGICKLAQGARPLECEFQADDQKFLRGKTDRRRIAIARDESFCFYYQENLDLLESFGWEPVFFSPIHDVRLPERIEACLFGGGYPECYARELSENSSMLESVRMAADGGLRILAECGGFLYLHRALEGMDGKAYPMAGVIPGEAYRTEKLSHFGYVTLSSSVAGKNTLPLNASEEDSQLAASGGDVIRGHEFHYWNSTKPGQDMRAKKPLSSRSWSCMYRSDHLLAGFPHLYYLSNPSMILRFLDGGMKGENQG